MKPTKAMLHQLPDVLTISETAAVLRHSERAIRRAIAKKSIKKIDLGDRRVLVSKKEIERLLGGGS